MQKKLINLIENGLSELAIPPSPGLLYDPFRYALGNGGKRIRPYLCLLAAGICNGKPKDALPAALATEVVHNFTLVHDDIMDKADIRRGQPSVYKKWNDSVAILAGDVMLAHSYSLLSHYGHSREFTKSEVQSIHDIFTKGLITVCEGQALDLEFTDRKEVSIKEYLYMIQGKTSSLLSVSLALGALSVHASEAEVESLTELGRQMGLAFQIQDDLLDAIADPEKFGKKPGGDIIEGKKTYLSICALNRCNPAQRNDLLQILQKKVISQAELDNVLQLFHDLHVIEDTAAQVEKYYQAALSLLNNFSDSEYKSELQKMLIFLSRRDH